MTKGQKSNISTLKEYVYDLIGMTTQKTAGQRRNVKNEFKEICYPLSADLRKRMSDAAITAYSEALKNTAEPQTTQ